MTGTGPMFCNVKCSAISIAIFAYAIEDSRLSPSGAFGVSVLCAVVWSS